MFKARPTTGAAAGCETAWQHGSEHLMEDEVDVRSRPDGEFEVEVRRGAVVTHHVVSVPVGLADQLGAPDVDGAELVRQSFAFLLEREPPSSIMRSFSLDVIERYFPEYRGVVAKRLA